MTNVKRLRRMLLPCAAFTIVLLFHFTWQGLVTRRNPLQGRWVAVPVSGQLSWLGSYIRSQSYWLGYSYALSLAFAAAMFRRFIENRRGADRNLAIGGITFTGLLATFGCFLLGCCGSPMMVVYLNLLGSRFLPFARPLVAALTTISVLLAWLWIRRWGDKCSTSCLDPECHCAHDP